MPKLRRQRRLANQAVLAVIAFALLAAVFLIYQTIEAERIEREQVQQTAAVIEELRLVNEAVLNAETGQRGYLITLDRRYLEPYQTGRDQIRPSLGRLRDSLGGDMTARQEELLDDIEILSDAKFAELRESVEMLENGDLIAARRQVLTDEGQELTDRLRRTLRALEDTEEEILLRAATQTARAEARVVPLLGMLLALLLVAILFGYRLAARAATAEAEAAQAAALGEARDRADLLARELNHRVKNLFAVILAIVRMGGREDKAAQPAAERMAERISALLTAHEVSQGSLEKPVASLQALIETTLRPYRSEAKRAEIAGPEVIIPAKRAGPLGLVLHELTTNAVKYGCWQDIGLLAVEWTVVEDEVRIDWQEHCKLEVEPSDRTGFGTRLMEAAARQLHGTIDRAIGPDGARVKIAFPLDIET